jgi:uncharacterized glyoxalase superfamily protein PhnB
MEPNYPDVIPMIAYEDGPRAMDWLASSFGFHERARMVGPDGRLGHGEMETGAGVIMLATPSPDYRGPKRHRESCDQASKWSSRARAAGARILSEVSDGANGKQYRVEDLEGHRWMFMERR